MNSKSIVSFFNTKKIKKIAYKILDIIYPKQCIICGKIYTEIICDECYYKNIFPIVKKQCRIERYNNKYFDEHLYIFKYKDEIRKLLIDYKFNEKAYLRDLFIKILIKNEKIYGKIKKYDIIIPIPIHKKRKRKRGYNQSELISIVLANQLENLELACDILVKQKNTKPQSSLNKDERQQNVKGVYGIKNKYKIANKRIILFDDIYTTGATVNECSRILKINGAKEILVFTIAKD